MSVFISLDTLLFTVSQQDQNLLLIIYPTCWNVCCWECVSCSTITLVVTAHIPMRQGGDARTSKGLCQAVMYIVVQLKLNYCGMLYSDFCLYRRESIPVVHTVTFMAVPELNREWLFDSSNVHPHEMAPGKIYFSIHVMSSCFVPGPETVFCTVFQGFLVASVNFHFS